MRDKKAVVVHSGGMDSSLCLALAMREFGTHNVHSLTFSYGQRHSSEIIQAQKICRDWRVHHRLVPLDSLQALTSNALIDSTVTIAQQAKAPPNTLVVGRNGLMAWLAAIHAHQIEAQCIFLGVMELEEANSGYRDCSRKYMDLLQNILRIDLDNPAFEIRTPLVQMLKKETLKLAYDMNILEYLLKETMTCYEGIPHQGCRMPVMSSSQ
jgi:7-cyano-7-deazaguanine synthase